MITFNSIALCVVKSITELLLGAEIKKLRDELQHALAERDELRAILEASKPTATALSIESPLTDSASVLDISRLDTPFFSPVPVIESPTEDKEVQSLASLMDACRQGDAATITSILAQARRLVNMRAVNSCGLSPLHAVCGRDSVGDVSTLRLLLDTFHADVRVVDDYGGSPLHYACANNHVEIIRTLINEQQLPVELPDKEGKSPLFYAAYNGSIEAVAVLVQELGADVNYHNPSNWSALHCAAMRGHLETAAMLAIQFHADVDSVNYVGKTPLHYAAELGHAKVAAMLAHDCRAQLNMRDATDSTPLHYACFKGHVEVVEALFDRRVEAEEEEESERPDCNLINKFSIAPLFYASAHRSPELLQLLIVEGQADVNAVNIDGFTALHYACITGTLSNVELLLQCGADLHQKNADGYSAIHHAFYNRHFAVLYLLLKRSFLEGSNTSAVLFFLLAMVVCGFALAMQWSF